MIEARPGAAGRPLAWLIVLALFFFIAAPASSRADEAEGVNNPRTLWVTSKAPLRATEDDLRLLNAITAAAEYAVRNSGRFSVVKVSSEADVALVAQMETLGARRIVAFEIVDLMTSKVLVNSRVECACSTAEILDPIHVSLGELIERPVMPGRIVSFEPVATPPGLDHGESELEVAGSPEQGIVFIDGNRWGYAPKAFRVSAGTHEVIVRREQFSEWATTVSLGERRRYSLRYRLIPWGRLSVAVSPHDSLMYVDGRLSRAKEYVPVSPGAHQLRFERYGFQAVVTSVTIPAGESLVYGATLHEDPQLRAERERRHAVARKVFIPSAALMIAGAVAMGVLARTPAQPIGIAVAGVGVLGVAVSLGFDSQVPYRVFYPSQTDPR